MDYFQIVLYVTPVLLFGHTHVLLGLGVGDNDPTIVSLHEQLYNLVLLL